MYADAFLEWFTAYRKRMHTHLARLQWKLTYIAALAETMEHAPLEDRQRIIAEIRDTAKDDD